MFRLNFEIQTALVWKCDTFMECFHFMNSLSDRMSYLEQRVWHLPIVRTQTLTHCYTLKLHFEQWFVFRFQKLQDFQTPYLVEKVELWLDFGIFVLLPKSLSCNKSYACKFRVFIRCYSIVLSTLDIFIASVVQWNQKKFRVASYTDLFIT